MKQKICDKKEIAVFIGTFDASDNTFTWNKFKAVDTLDEGYEVFDTLCRKCLSKTFDFLTEKYDSPRIDIELMVGSKMVKWFGVYDKGPQFDLDKALRKAEKEGSYEDSLPKELQIDDLIVEAKQTARDSFTCDVYSNTYRPLCSGMKIKALTHDDAAKIAINKIR